MATWHQRQNKAKLDAKDVWTVVIDPPNGCTCLMRFDDAESAKEYMKKVEHTYLLPPSKI